MTQWPSMTNHHPCSLSKLSINVKHLHSVPLAPALSAVFNAKSSFRPVPTELKDCLVTSIKSNVPNTKAATKMKRKEEISFYILIYFDIFCCTLTSQHSLTIQTLNKPSWSTENVSSKAAHICPPAIRTVPNGLRRYSASRQWLSRAQASIEVL